MESVRVQLESIFQGLIASTIAAIPRILVGIVLVIVAFIAAALIERLLRVALVRLRFDSLVRRTGVDNWLQRAGIRRSIDEFIPRIGYFLLLFIFARTAADALGLTAISNAIGSVLDYLPKLIAALLILILGSAAAQFIARAVTSAAENTGFQFSRARGSFVAGVTLYVLGVMALSQLEVDTEIIRLVTAAVLAGATLALGLLNNSGAAVAEQSFDLTSFGADFVFKLDAGRLVPYAKLGAGVLRFDPDRAIRWTPRLR